MGRVVHFEIHASNPDQLVGFYRELFGWDLQKWEGPMDYWTIATGAEDEPGIHGGLLRRQGAAPAHGQSVNSFVCTVAVDNVDGSVARAQSLGGNVALPKMAVPGVGWLAYILDPDGNIFGMMQNDPSAA